MLNTLTEPTDELAHALNKQGISEPNPLQLATLERIPDPNAEIIAKHIWALMGVYMENYSDGKFQIQALCPNKEKRAEFKYYPICDEAISYAINDAVVLNKAGYNIYVGVHPRKPETPNDKNAANEDVEIARVVFVDSDSEESLSKLSADCPVPPSFTVTTGTTPHKRMHCYWILEEPITDMAWYILVQKTLQERFGTDSVHDPRRILRLAGTVSYPNKNKIDRGYKPELVTLEDQDRDEDLS